MYLCDPKEDEVIQTILKITTWNSQDGFRPVHAGRVRRVSSRPSFFFFFKLNFQNYFSYKAWLSDGSTFIDQKANIYSSLGRPFSFENFRMMVVSIEGGQDVS